MVHQLPSRNDLFRERIEEFEKPLDLAAAGTVRAVRRARVASRRLRELLPIMEADADDCRRVLRKLRQVTRQLGRLRELDVSVELLERMRDPARSRRSPGMRLLRERLTEARRDAFAHVQAKGLGGTLRRTAGLLERLAEGLSDVSPSRDRRWRWTLDARVARRAAAVLVAMDRAGVEYVPERLHEVRIELKKLRYGLELAEAANGMPPTADLRRLMSAQARLGRLHDREVLIGWVSDVRSSLTRRHLSARRDLSGLSVDIEADCRVLHAAYRRSRKALGDTCQRLLARARSAGTSVDGSRGPAGLRRIRLA